MDDCLGQVVIPVKDLVSNEREGGEQVEIQGFFRITSLGKEGGGEWKATAKRTGVCTFSIQF